ncbi:MAG TPA: hypothetical protein VFS16_06325 [Acidimicrobiia bacterium]|nr:hypothetical protein [Acidimicrobiia bacterium]
MRYDTAARTLTITLGTGSGSRSEQVDLAAPTYVADTGITDRSGVPVNNSPFRLSPGKWF